MPSVEPAHSPHRRTSDLLQRLAPGKMRIGFLVGAGCPLSVLQNGAPLIPGIEGLTKEVQAALAGKAKDIAGQMWARVVARGIASPTVEDVLSHLRTLKSVCEIGSVDGFSSEDLTLLDDAICKEVRTRVSKKLPSSDTPYHVLASWIQAIARDKPLEIFTTNYDLLLEQALEEQAVPYFDGFVGADSAFLDLESMAEDDLPARWARLWKLHGSVNWWVNEDKRIRRSRDSMPGEQLLIYPSHLKYDQSRQMPYYAMLDRLRVFLRSEQSVLLTCGYSFADEHINAHIGQGLAGNPNASCIAMIYTDRACVKKAVSLAKKHANLTLLAADGGVVGTIDRAWSAEDKDSNPAYAISVSKTVAADRSKAPPDQNKWLLGDFSSFGKFLAYQLSTRDIEQGVADAL